MTVLGHACAAYTQPAARLSIPARVVYTASKAVRQHLPGVSLSLSPVSGRRTRAIRSQSKEPDRKVCAAQMSAGSPGNRSKCSMAEVTEAELEAQRSTRAKSGFLGVKVTTSRKYQPQIWCPELGMMRGLGSFDDAEEAAAELIKAKRDGPGFQGPVDHRAKRGTVHST